MRGESRVNPRSCAELAPEAKKGVPRRARFLAKLAGWMPGSALERGLAPFYPQAAMRPRQRRLLDKDGPEEAVEKGKAAGRAKVAHPFLYVKRHFGYRKVHYRGLAKNTQRSALLRGVDRGPLRERLTWGQCARTLKKAVKTARNP